MAFIVIRKLAMLFLAFPPPTSETHLLFIVNTKSMSVQKINGKGLVKLT